MITLPLSFVTNTPIAQGIEHRPPEAGAAVRIRLGVFLNLQKSRKNKALHAMMRR